MQRGWMPIKFKGQKFMVKVTIDKYRNNLVIVNMIFFKLLYLIITDT